MRITMVTRWYWPARGGVETYSRHVARGLARDHAVHVLAQGVQEGPTTRLSGNLVPYAPFEPFVDDGVRVSQFGPSALRRAALSPLALQIAPGARRYAHGRLRHAYAGLYARVVAPEIVPAARAGEVVHVWSGDMLGAAAVRAAHRAGRPVLMTPFVHPGQWSDDVASIAAYRRADRVVGLLNTDADVLRGFGIPEDRVRVCGVCSPGVERGGGAALRAERGISGPLIVFLGVRRPYKGFNLLLDAARRLPSTVTVAFVGPGAEIDTDVAGGARIIDAGPVDDARKAAWLDAADLYCLPSEGEIFPVSILEAWSAATPILVSDIPPLRELVTRTGGGRAVQRDADVLARSINELLAAPEELASMGERGFAAWKRDFTVEAIAGWYAEEYARVVGEHNGRAAGASLGSRV